MVTSTFLTDSGINLVTGGGIVGANMIDSLEKYNPQYIFSKEKIKTIKNIPNYSINPFDYGYSNENPFFIDYICFHFIPRISIDLVVTYGCPFGLTIEEYKRVFKSKIICDLPPHNIDISKEEHQKHGVEYRYPHLVDDMLWKLYSRHLNLADRVIVHSKKSAEYIQKKSCLKEMPVVIPHGCFPPDKTPILPDNISPGYFGACGFDKGIIYLIKSWAESKYSHNKYLYLGGHDSKNFKYPDIRFKPLGSIDDLTDFYKYINFGIYPSVTEGFNICALETMAYGRPIIVAEGAGVSEFIQDGREGFIVPIRDIEAIKNKINYFYENPSEIKRMGVEARKTAEQYTWENIIKIYEKIYEETI